VAPRPAARAPLVAFRLNAVDELPRTRRGWGVTGIGVPDSGFAATRPSRTKKPFNDDLEAFVPDGSCLVLFELKGTVRKKPAPPYWLSPRSPPHAAGEAAPLFPRLRAQTGVLL
jgi:hypothetical protein